MNGVYLREMSPESTRLSWSRTCGNRLRRGRGDDPRLGAARAGEDRPARGVSGFGFLFERREAPPELIDGSGPVLAEARETLAAVEPFAAQEIEAALRGLAERLGTKPREAAPSGRPSPARGSHPVSPRAWNCSGVKSRWRALDAALAVAA